MLKASLKKTLRTNDSIIRSALKKELLMRHSKDKKFRIIEELGVNHGTARIDIAVVNGIMHGYEIKSDLDTLERLPEQMNVFSAVFNMITLVVGKSHLYNAINLVPEWWGIIVAKTDMDGSVIFNLIREAGNNIEQNGISIARLLWKKEALRILEDAGKANGLYSKPRDYIYERLAMFLDKESLGEKVIDAMFFRPEWRPDAPLILNGG